MESPSQSSQAQLCRNGCGFYGSPKNDGMCSMCYKDIIQKKNNSGRKSPSSVAVTSKEKKLNSSSVISDGSVANAMASLATTDKVDEDVTLVTNVSNSSLSSSTATPAAVPSATDPSTGLTTPSQTSIGGEASSSIDSESPSPSKPKKNRCASCRKRLGLTGFYCRCGNTYCGLHRYSDQHSCEFDYKADAQAKIRKENPVVVGEKINKI